MPSRKVAFCALVALAVFVGLLPPCAGNAIADDEYSAEELQAGRDEQRNQIEAAQRELKEAKAQLSKAVRSRNPEGNESARGKITATERAIRELRKRSAASFEQEKREAAKREEAEQRARKAADEARIEVMRRPKIDLASMSVGDQGYVQDFNGEGYKLQVAFIREEGNGVLAKVPAAGTCVFVQGIDMRGLTTNRWFSLPKQMKVVGTDNCLADGNEVSYFVLSPLNPGEKAVTMREAPQRPLPPLSTQKVPIRFP